MPGKAYFLEDGAILSIPRDDGDCRYPYGHNGFNLWAYTSGYMHGNEGLFSPFLRASEGQEPKIAFFAVVPAESGSCAPISLLPVPVLEEEEKFAIEHYTVFAKSAVYYFTECRDLCFAVRVFVNAANDIFFSISARNATGKAQEIFLSSFLNPFLAHDIVENAEHRWYREVKAVQSADSQRELGSFIIKVNEDISRTCSITNYGFICSNIELGGNGRMVRHEETTSRYQYVGGRRRNLNNAASLKSGTFGGAKRVCTFTEVGIAANLIHLEIGAAETVRLNTALFHDANETNEANVKQWIRKSIGSEMIDNDLVLSEKAESERRTGLSAIIGRSDQKLLKQTVFNCFFECLKRQVEFCALIKGYVQLSPMSLIGIRDVFQALEGLLFWQPQAARAKMLEALHFIFSDGRCPRQYSLPIDNEGNPTFDLRPFIDQGVWVISTIVTYLRFTGDFDFLQQVCGYYEIVDETSKSIKKSLLKDSVLDHLLKITEYLIAHLDKQTHCLHALYGDWNDALDGLGVTQDPAKDYGTGVSIMATLQVYQNLKEMIELLERVDPGTFANRISRFRAVLGEVEKGLFNSAIVQNQDGERRILHGWGDERSYFVGSFNDSDGQARDGLTSNAFWVLAGLYDLDTSIRTDILSALRRLDSKYGLRTFAPHFERNAPGVGRIPKLPPGTAENGAAYVHASVFGIMALFRMGCPKEAWEQLFKSLPFTHETISVSPFVMPNSYGFNPAKLIDGESMADWQTGSSNGVLKTLLRFGFGFEPHFDGIWIQPAAWLPFNSFAFTIKVRTCKVTIQYRNRGLGERKYAVNGANRNSRFDPVMRLAKLWIANEELGRTRELTIEVWD